VTLNNSNEKDIFKLINKAFNYNICNAQHFTSAFTHKTTSDKNYERLEILGDSVLQLTVTELLFIKYPEYTEGQITVVRQNLVNSKSLKRIFLSLKLENIVKKMNPKLTEGNIYSDIFESLIGALYLDSNYETVKDIVHNLFVPLLSDNLSDKDAKTLLQEYMHSKKLRLPSYSTSVIKDAKYNYLITCELLDLNIKESLQSNKVKPAEQKLARALLNKLNEEN
jgi:ribonuclease-3